MSHGQLPNRLGLKNCGGPTRKLGAAEGPRNNIAQSHTHKLFLPPSLFLAPHRNHPTVGRPSKVDPHPQKTGFEEVMMVVP